MELLKGFGESLQVFGLTLLFSIPLGLVVCFGSMSKFKPLQALTRGFVWIIRGSPLMLQLIIIFYGPGLMFGLPAMPRFTATILAFSINYACYFSEIYRGGITKINFALNCAKVLLYICISNVGDADFFYNLCMI